jgi:lysophospholipase L1-like esterase
MIAESRTYLEPVLCEMQKQWPENRAVNVVCHGHSVPAGYFATPFVDTFHAYPHLLHRHIKERFPFAVVNVIVTAIGGETSLSGSKRFDNDVLCHKPEVITIDYSLNDRGLSIHEAKACWSEMIEKSLARGVRIILLTPSWQKAFFEQNESWKALVSHAQQVRTLADQYNVGLSDSFQAFQRYIDQGGDLADLLSHVNHPNCKGHELIAGELARWFMAK